MRDPVFGSSLASIVNPWTALRYRGEDKTEAARWEGVIKHYLRALQVCLQMCCAIAPADPPKTFLDNVQRRSRPSSRRVDPQSRRDPIVKVASQDKPIVTGAPAPATVNQSLVEQEYLCTFNWDEESVRLLRDGLNAPPDLSSMAPSSHDAQMWIDWLDDVGYPTY